MGRELARASRDAIFMYGKIHEQLQTTMFGGRCGGALLVWGALLAADVAMAQPHAPDEAPAACRAWTPEELDRNPTPAELRCRYGIAGPGRFGLLSYLDVPVYQSATPMPGTHLVGVPGHAGPRDGESYEAWEWRVLRTEYGPEAQKVRRDLELLDPFVAARILRFEAALREAGVRAQRLETWRAPERQAWLFQQGRSRPGPLATTTLTSWHSQVDARGTPAGRAADYRVPPAQMRRFHAVAREVGLFTYGADSNDPGHVFLPDPKEVPVKEIILLRLLPRVPVVTLATGLPVDRPVPQGGLARVRAACLEFIEAPFIASPAPSVASRMLSPAPVTRAASGTSDRQP